MFSILVGITFKKPFYPKAVSNFVVEVCFLETGSNWAFLKIDSVCLCLSIEELRPSVFRVMETVF